MSGQATADVKHLVTKRVAFRIVALLLAGLVGLVSAEWLLRWRQRSIANSDHPDPGLVQYDPRLGWRLTPGWRGRHTHHDFDVSYTIDPSGFRFDPAQPKEKRGRLIAVVGDSFTFGLGVNDDQTFVSLLNQKGTNTYLNLAIPGYSNDQEALLIEDEMPTRHPDEVLLVAYVGNDLIDNQRARPIQFNAAKPYFALGPEGLLLRDVPVPTEASAFEASPPDLAEVVLGREYYRSSLWNRLGRRFVLAGFLRGKVLPVPDHTADFGTQFRTAVELFAAILDRIGKDCEKSKARLAVAVLAGRSFVEEPASLSSQYQQFFATNVLSLCAMRRIPTCDLAASLRLEFDQHKTNCFHRNDGHLTPLGHVVVARVLSVASTAVPSK